MRTRGRVSETSVTAYYHMLAGPQLGQQQRAIVDLLEIHPDRDFTRAEIADALGIKLQSVCGRTRELIDQGVATETGRRPCNVNGSLAMAVKLAPAQGEMFPQ